MNNVLILGHSGFIGQTLCKVLADLKDTTVTGQSYQEGDLCDPKYSSSFPEILDKETSVIFLSGIKKQYGDSYEMFSKNVSMVQNFCDVIRNSPPLYVIFFSSAAIYAEDIHNLSITENTQPQPRSYYGISKFACERLLAKTCEEVGTDLLIVRPTTIYGPGDSTVTYGPYAFLKDCVDGDGATLWGDGTELRDFIHVSDVAHITATLLEQKAVGLVNVATGVSHSFQHMVEFCLQATKADLRITNRERTKAKVDQRFVINRLIEMVGDYQFISMEKGIEAMYREMANHDG
jgi:UDP-glucose 4-epimerase